MVDLENFIFIRGVFFKNRKTDFYGISTIIKEILTCLGSFLIGNSLLGRLDRSKAENSQFGKKIQEAKFLLITILKKLGRL